MDGELSVQEVPLEQKRKAWHRYGKLLIAACFILYIGMLAAKNVYSAEIATIILKMETDKATASLANTYYYVIYGAVQVVLCVLMAKIDMGKYLSFTVPFGALTIILMGFATNITQMYILFAVSGIFQAGIWSGLNLILTTHLPKKLLSSANRMLNIGFPIGSVIAYGISALCVSFDVWRVPFMILGGFFFAAIIFFAFVVRKANSFKGIPDDDAIAVGKKIESDKPLILLDTGKKKACFYLIVLLMSFLICSLYYCVNSWLTSLLVEVYSFPQDISIYVAILAPIATVFGPMLTLWSCDRNGNFIAVAIKYMLILLPISLLIVFFYSANVILALVLLVAFLMISNGVKAIVLSVVTFKLRTQFNAGSYSALFNASASAAAGVTPTVIGAVIDGYGWQTSYIVVVVMCVVVAISLCAINILVKINNSKRAASEN